MSPELLEMFLLPLVKSALGTLFHCSVGLGEPGRIKVSCFQIVLVLAHGGAEVRVVADEVLRELTIGGEVDVVREKVCDLFLVIIGKEGLKLRL